MKHWHLRALVLVCVLGGVGCGGGSGSGSAPSEPVEPVQPQPVKLALLTGKTAVDFDHCRSVDGTTEAAQYSRLLRATVYKDAVYLVESGERCTNVTYEPPVFIPKGVQPAIRKLSDGKVETALHLHSYISMMSHPVMVRYPSGVHRAPGNGALMVSGYAAAFSDHDFRLDETEVARYSELGGWGYYTPGLFRFNARHADYEDLIAGRPGQPPERVDGSGQDAGFHAPHDLEVDASGTYYLIDQGLIRTVDAQATVRTLDSAALGITGSIRSLDADHKGQIHVLAQRGTASYTWHRLADGRKVEFSIPRPVMLESPAAVTFTVVGDALVFSERPMNGDSAWLYRVSAAGETKPLAADAMPLPQVQHLEYGVDGNLYVVLPQGVLVARDFQ